jgi:hypothetical protein
MPDRIDTLGSLVEEVDHALHLGAQGPSLLASDAAAYLELSKRTNGRPAAQVPTLLPNEAALDALLAQLAPPPPTGVSSQTVAPALEAAVTVGGNIMAAVDALAKLDWVSTWEVIWRLGSSGPTLDGQTYLELLESAMRPLPNVDPRASAAVLAGVLARGGRTVATGAVSAWLRLTDYLLVLDPIAQMEILGRFGVPPEAAEGTLAVMISEALEAALTPSNLAPAGLMAAAIIPPSWFARLKQLWDGINTNTQSFLDFTKPESQPYGYYIGTQVHLAIAAYYRGFHASHLVWTNVTPVMSILGALQTKFAFQGSGLAGALAASRPDIFEFGFIHGMPPGWVFEIKPASHGAGAARAEFEVLFYATALTLCDIPAVPGPITAAGVEGVVPVAGGWAAFVCPLPGVILYYYKQASKQALAQRSQVRVNSAVRVSTEELVRASGTAADVAKAGLLAAIFAAIIEYGWTVVFL